MIFHLVIMVRHQSAVVRFVKNHTQPRSNERGLDFLVRGINGDPNVCGRQEIQCILIGNCVRKLNDTLSRV